MHWETPGTANEAGSGLLWTVSVPCETGGLAALPSWDPMKAVTFDASALDLGRRRRILRLPLANHIWAWQRVIGL
ncbi:hypothetical protein [Sedimentitalea sp.]|uniref:hypothetical protein n=1 Tax=Sedimentitalea sp. TaxID=2048915 RepID=UPI003297DA03